MLKISKIFIRPAEYDFYIILYSHLATHTFVYTEGHYVKT